MRNRNNFIRTNKEFEPIFEGALYNKPFIEEYKNRELNRTNIMNKIVYDCFDTNSPYYNSPQDYIRSEDQIVLPTDKGENPN